MLEKMEMFSLDEAGAQERRPLGRGHRSGDNRVESLCVEFGASAGQCGLGERVRRTQGDQIGKIAAGPPTPGPEPGTVDGERLKGHICCHVTPRRAHGGRATLQLLRSAACLH